MKKIYCLFLSILLFQLNTNAQSYTVSMGNRPYSTLVNYESIDFFLEETLNIPFKFPFFGANQNEVTVDGSYGSLDFPNSQNMSIDAFAGLFEYNLFKPSDLRWAVELEAGSNVLKIEWLNVALSEDYMVNPTDHWINYQLWLYENGDIELHFGDINLDNTPYYTDSTGFVFASSLETFGPWIGIEKQNPTEVLYISGNFDNPIYYYDADSIDIFYGIPPEGAYLRFTYQATSVEVSSVTNVGLAIFPNPTKSSFFLDGDKSQIEEAVLINVMGQENQYFTASELQGNIDISSLAKGVYILKISKKNGNSELIKLVIQ